MSSINNIIETWISDGIHELKQTEIDILIKNAKPLEINAPLYRGLVLSNEKYIKPHAQLTSWTLDSAVAENFGDVVLEWKPTNPVMGIDLTGINYNEKEIIVCTKS